MNDEELGQDLLEAKKVPKIRIIDSVPPEEPNLDDLINASLSASKGAAARGGVSGAERVIEDAVQKIESATFTGKVRTRCHGPGFRGRSNGRQTATCTRPPLRMWLAFGSVQPRARIIAQH